MSVLFFWTGGNYSRDIRIDGKTYALNQNNELIFDLKPGEHIWSFTRRPDKRYVLALDLVVTGTSQNQKSDPGYEYGKYHAEGDRLRSRYFNVQTGPDVEPFIRRLSVAPKARILGHSFQGESGVRLLTVSDEQALIRFSATLRTI